MKTFSDGHAQSADERERDLRHAAGMLAQLDRDDKEVALYDHVSHGCPFEDSGVECPVGCDAPDNIAMQSAAFFGDATGVR